MQVPGVAPGSNFPAIPPTSGSQAYSLELLEEINSLASKTQMHILASQTQDLMAAAMASKAI